MENTKQIEDLLVKVNDIQKREKELSKLRGEHFNVFRLLGLEGNEAGFHTKFLFELLNPQGSHGKGSIYFEEFIRFMNNLLPFQAKIPNYSINKIEAKKEIYVGPINFVDKEGGQIDLYFETDSFALAVENKIYSGLGYLQLERYQKFLASKVNKIQYLILLSPFNIKYNGSLKEGNDFYHLKYSDLIPWLEYCMEKSADFPILRETIKQYIISVKGILGILTNQEMKKELEDLILKNYDAARFISEAFSQAKELRIKKMYEIVLNKLSEKFKLPDWETDLKIKTIESRDWGFNLRKSDWPEGLFILFQGNRVLLSGIVPTIFIKNISENGWDEIKSKYKNKTQHKNQIQFKGKYNSLIFLLESNQSPEQMAQDLILYLENTIEQLSSEIMKLKEILN